MMNDVSREDQYVIARRSAIHSVWWSGERWVLDLKDAMYYEEGDLAVAKDEACAVHERLNGSCLIEVLKIERTYIPTRAMTERTYIPTRAMHILPVVGKHHVLGQQIDQASVAKGSIMDNQVGEDPIMLEIERLKRKVNVLQGELKRVIDNAKLLGEKYKRLYKLRGEEVEEEIIKHVSTRLDLEKEE